MSSYRGHLVGGVAAAGIYTAAMLFVPIVQFATYANLLHDYQVFIAVFVVAMLFALFPDVDTKSKGQGIFYWGAFILNILLIWNKQIQAAAYLGLVAMLPLLTHHRGWTHSVWAALLVPLPIVGVPYLFSDRMLPVSLVFYGAAVVGYLSHLALDGVLLRGVKRLTD